MTRGDRLRVAVTVVALATIPGGADAQDAGRRLTIHGYGNWTYGNTDGNTYAVGSPVGEYENGEVAFTFSSQLSDKLFVYSQSSLISRPGAEVEAEIDFAVAEWRFSDALVFRGGRGKHPFGIYTEIFDVGTLRPFSLLPRGLYGPSGFIAEGYVGFGLAGSRYGKSGWGVEYDAYVGGVERLSDEEGEEEAAAGGDPDGTGGHAPEGAAIRDLVGGRIRLTTPIPGFNFGVSAYSGTEADDERGTVWSGHVEYLRRGWSVRGEWADNRAGSDRSRTWYAEAARRWRGFQLAVRYDRWREAGADEDDVAERHEDWSFGVNYWLAPEFVVKAAHHRVDGTRFVRGPAERAQTRMWVVGVDFAF